MGTTSIANASVPRRSSSNQNKPGRLPMSKTLKCASLLSCLVLCSGCESGIAVIATEQLCNDWRRLTISKKDVLTEETASQIEASNKSRPNWGCKYGEPT